jgi:hypothetical protein
MELFLDRECDWERAAPQRDAEPERANRSTKKKSVHNRYANSNGPASALLQPQAALPRRLQTIHDPIESEAMKRGSC